MVTPAQRGSGLGSIEVGATGVTMQTALRRMIEIRREDVARVEVNTVRLPPFSWATNFSLVGGDNKRARHYFAAYRTSALRAAFDALGYTVVDAWRRAQPGS